MRTLFIAFFLGISYFLSACNLQTNRNQVEKEKEPIVFELDSAEVYKNPGVPYLELSEFDKFPVEFKEAIQVEPRAKIYKNIGASYLEQGKVDEAIGAFKKAVQIDPNFVEAHYLLADVYSIKGEGVLSRKFLDQAMALEGSYIIDARSYPPEFFRGPITRDIPSTRKKP